jgi:glycosyltransferase involved in cell wall biosynthesis
MTRRRILYVQPVAEKGGMEANLLAEISHINSSEFVPIVAVLEQGPLVEELRAAGAAVHTIPRRRLRRPLATIITIVRLARLIQRERIDLVVCENALAHVYGRLAALLARRPCVLVCGGAGSPAEMVERIAYRLGANRVIANSRHTERGLAASGVPQDRMIVIHRGLDLDDFASRVDESRVRAELGITPTIRVITTVGRLQRWKGQHVVIRAARLVIAKFTNVRFLIVGDALFGIETDYPAELRALIAELGLGANVTMTGFRNDIPAILAASDIVLVPSVVPEPFGMVTIEAMAVGRAVVGTDSGGTKEIITEGESGLLVRPNSPEALAEAILTLLADDGFRTMLGGRARVVVRDRFSIDRMVKEHERVYEDCIKALP